MGPAEETRGGAHISEAIAVGSGVPGAGYLHSNLILPANEHCSLGSNTEPLNLGNYNHRISLGVCPVPSTAPSSQVPPEAGTSISPFYRWRN